MHDIEKLLVLFCKGMDSG
ncbi:Protein of unknown function [Bacillus thuringiensis]|uniref:Uncharacterized protein n=1 Tax=Bacillus thuringiensis TaxID=1428 RepID=A0A1C3ZUW6_BACTU|nr:Protein of unknown function [Bacillus thuringiensis]SCL83015.1 Protein of unknown function [Bacillus wiedmannii]SCN00871.1 Protein of unknown function [Bacillus wiedmannii]